MSGKENIIPQSTAILDGAKRLVSLDLADDTGIDSILAGDSLQLDQRCPSNELESMVHEQSISCANLSSITAHVKRDTKDK
jgi:methyl coenzyme M reductase beta subunit